MTSNDPAVNSKKTATMPDAFVILFFIMIAAFAASHILPQGQFATETYQVLNGDEVLEKTRIVEDSFHIVESSQSGVPVFATGGNAGLLNYAFEGLVSGDKWGSAVGVVAFILIVGGAFGIIMGTGSINNGIMALISKTQQADKVIIPLMFLLFSLAGAIFGMGEEAIAFCIIMVPLMIAMGYDSITAVLITYVATQIGFATSWMNPFSVAIAQGIADVPLMSGQAYRMILWAVFTSIGLLFTWRYALNIKRAPHKSLAFDSDAYFKNKQFTLNAHYTWFDTLVLITFALGILWVIWGVVIHAYYIPEIAAQFFTIGLCIGAISVFCKRLSMNEVSEAFQKGAKELLPAALIVGMAKGIIIILGGDDVTQPSTLNTVLFYASQSIEGIGAIGSAIAMLIFQTSFNFFVASGSGQAAITMPLMAPLADLVGITRQVAVLAFQLGDGLSNIIIPTSASLIGCLGVARLDWSIWVRFAWKLFLILFATAILSVSAAVIIAYQ